MVPTADTARKLQSHFLEAILSGLRGDEYYGKANRLFLAQRFLLLLFNYRIVAALSNLTGTVCCELVQVVRRCTK